jgi:hypothetical protein
MIIEEPSAVIRMRLGKPAGRSLMGFCEMSNPGCSTSSAEDDCVLGRKAVCKDRACAINFFDWDARGMEERHMRSMSPFGASREAKCIFSDEFIRVALENDVRVKSAKYASNLVFIYFYTTEDAVSFYRQFYSLADISFSHAYDYEQVMLLTCAEWSNLQLTNTKEDEQRPRRRPAADSGRPRDSVANDKSLRKMIFDKKVEYFTKIRNFFTKAEVKAMAQSLEEGNIDFVFKHTKELAVGNHSNKIMQDTIKMLSEEELARVIEKIEYDIAPIAANKHGAYTVQMLISASKTEVTQGLLSKYFREAGEFLIAHEIGNYTVQKLLRFDSELVFNFFMSNLPDVIEKELGMKVFKRCLEFFSDKKKVLLERIQSYYDENIRAEVKVV